MRPRTAVAGGFGRFFNLAQYPHAKAELCGVALIKTIEVTDYGSYVDIDLSDINWDEWQAVAFGVDYWPQGSTSNNTTYNIVYTTKSGVTPTYVSSNSTDRFGSFTAGLFYTLLLPFHDKTRRMLGIQLAHSFSIALGSCTFDDLLNCRITYTPGSYYFTPITIRVWGLR